MDRHSSYTAPRSDRSPASRGSRRSPKTSNNGRSGNENRFLHNLLWYVLPFIVFNLLLLFLVTASPRIELTVGDTTDYKTVDVSIKVKSLIPIRKLTTTLESQDIEFKKEGGVYHSTLTNNGALEIYVESWNGMPARQNEHIAVLDDTAPSIDEETVVMEDGKLELIAEDNISGINYEAVYATDDAGKRTAPVSYDKETGRITFDLEKGSLTVYLEDMAGNANQACFFLKHLLALTQTAGKQISRKTEKTAQTEIKKRRTRKPPIPIRKRRPRARKPQSLPKLPRIQRRLSLPRRLRVRKPLRMQRPQRARKLQNPRRLLRVQRPQNLPKLQRTQKPQKLLRRPRVQKLPRLRRLPKIQKPPKLHLLQKQQKLPKLQRLPKLHRNPNRQNPLLLRKQYL